MEYIGLIVGLTGLFLTALLFLVGRLVFLQDRSYKSQEKFNDKMTKVFEQNVLDHAEFTKQLEIGNISHLKVDENSEVLKEHEKRLNKHDNKFIELGKDVDTLYKKVE